jgi:murein DD-endopeptidase MepM/ murein hydrolase activator NlpD
LYKLDRGRYLEMLLSSQDFQQFTARITTFEQIMKEDRSLLDETQQLITTVQDQKQQLQEQKELLISQQEQYAVLKDKTQAEKDSLQNDLAQKGELVAQAQQEQAGLQGQQPELNQQIADDQAHIADLLARQAKGSYTGEPSAAGFIWPVVGGITSGFGWRAEFGDFHRGIDIGASYGTPIEAAKDGVVIDAEYIGSYGNIVLIDHLDGLQTAYAHLSGFNVDVGEQVKQGDVIGWVGMTGFTTGPHLHFEVRSGGDFVNPVDFLP